MNKDGRKTGIESSMKTPQPSSFNMTYAVQSTGKPTTVSGDLAIG